MGLDLCSFLCCSHRIPISFVVVCLLYQVYSYIAYNIYHIVKKNDATAVKTEENHGRGLIKMTKRLAGYPVTLFIVYFPLGLQRILLAANINLPLNYFFVATALFILAGFFNAIVYGTTRSVLKVSVTDLV